MKKRRNKRIIVSVTNDLVSDNRVHKVCTTLQKMGFEVLLAGRRLPGSLSVPARSYSIRRFSLIFNRGPLFYAFFNLRLLVFLLFSKSNVLLSNDLDTLPANYLISKLKGIPWFTTAMSFYGSTELIHRPVVKYIWQWLEQKMLPNLEYAYTVCESIARIYKEKYGTPFRVVRNVSMAKSDDSSFKMNDQGSGKIILYQGAVNIHRGLEQAIRAMRWIDGACLIIAGDGDIKQSLEKLVREEMLQDKVHFTGRMTIEDLARITPAADLGLSVEEDIGVNYRYALPNKLFDYIQAEVPVLVANLPEMAAIVSRYRVGEVTDTLAPEILAGKMNDLLFNQSKRNELEKNLKKAAKELTWENEEKILLEIFQPFLEKRNKKRR